MLAHTGFAQLPAKLVFDGMRPKLSVIANQSAFLVWQSPGPMESGHDYHQKSRRLLFFRVLFGTFPLYPGDCHSVRTGSQ